MSKKPMHPEDPWNVDHGAPECDDQLAVFSKVGRGLRGDGFKVIVKSDEDAETYLEGLSYDAATKTYNSEWVSKNINGGVMMYQYNLRPYTIPQTFTITFRYKKPNRSNSEWTWTTPAIPYIWDADNNGLADVDEIVGTGVAALFLKKTTEPQWYFPTITATDYANGLMTAEKHDKLVYPDDWTREMFNAPTPGDPWSVNLQYGIGGDLDAPNIDDIAKLLGITVQQVRNIIAGQTGQIEGDGFTGDNMKDYVDKLCEHIHSDMGFDDHLVADDNDVTRNTIKKYIDGLRDDLYDNLGVTDPSSNFYADNGDLDLTYVQKYGTTTHHTTLKAYIDARCDDLNEGIVAAQTKADQADGKANNLKSALQALVSKIYGSGTVLDNGTINWGNSPLAGNTTKIAIGNINVLSNSTSNAILTHDGTYTGDLKGE